MFTVGTVDVMSTEYRPSIGRYFVDAPRPNIGHMSAVYQSLSVICRSTVGGISVNYRSHISRMSYVSANYWPIHRSSIGQVSANYRPSVGQVSAKCLRGIGDLKAISADIHIDRLSTECRPSVDRQSTECRSTVDRVSIDSRSSVDRVSTATSTDIAVDIAVDSTYSKHDPKFLHKKDKQTISCFVAGLLILDDATLHPPQGVFRGRERRPPSSRDEFIRTSSLYRS